MGVIATRRVHYWTGLRNRPTHCGRYDLDPRARSLAIADVTCKNCLKRLWAEIALAHFRAFGAGDTAFGRRIRKAMRESELATRTAA